MELLFNGTQLWHGLFVIGFIPIIVGTIVLFKGIHNESNVFYFLLSLSISVWVPSVGLFETIASPALAETFFNISILGANTTVLCLLYFAFSFGKQRSLSLRWVISLALPFLALSLPIIFLGNVFSLLPGHGIFGKGITCSTLCLPIVLFPLFYVNISLLILLRQYFTSAGVYRQKQKWILYLILIASIAGTIANSILPFLGHTEFFFIGPFVIIVGSSYLGFFLASYNLWDTKIFATKIFSVLIMLALGASVFSSNSLSEYIVKSVFFLLGSGAAAYLYRSMKNETKAEERVEDLLKVLTKQHEELEALNRRTSVFVTATANQLRDPLSGIRWHASSLLQGSFGVLPEQTRPYVDRIFESSKRLIVIVDDFLNLREIEQGRMKYTYSHFDVRPLVKSVIEETSALAAEKKLTVKYKDDASDSYPVNADQGKIRQVISNLIDNAIKYTKTGDIEVSLFQKTGNICVSVHDHGIGLSYPQISMLFKKFSRTKEAKKVNTGGSGLGLYIAQEIIKANGGDISASSDGLGMGAVFTVKLPKKV